MYFSVDQIKNDRAAQLAVMAANELGEQMLAGEQSSVAFEAAIASISGKTHFDTAIVAAKLLSQEVDQRRKAIRAGMKEIVQLLGGEKNAQQFFQQVSLPKARIRFESVGGMRSDVHSAKNRAAMLAMRAANDRRRQPNVPGRMPSEQEFVDFTKSVTRTLDIAVEAGAVNADVARDVALEIETAAYSDLSGPKKTIVTALQAEASREVFDEARKRLMSRYKSLRPEKPDPGKNPSIH